jgi:hypothetical protein
MCSFPSTADGHGRGERQRTSASPQGYIVNLTRDEREVLTLVLVEATERRTNIDIKRLRTLLTAWKVSRRCGGVTWRFTAAAARIKLRRLHPSLQ